jgi:plasmid maintenance system killer protein
VIILFANSKLQREFSDDKKLKRARGDRQGKLIRQRLSELKAANTLADMWTLPAARCHELTKDLKGRVSLDLDYPYRLIISATGESVRYRLDGSLVHDSVTTVVVEGVGNTHE